MNTAIPSIPVYAFNNVLAFFDVFDFMNLRCVDFYPKNQQCCFTAQLLLYSLTTEEEKLVGMLSVSNISLLIYMYEYIYIHAMNTK